MSAIASILANVAQTLTDEQIARLSEALRKGQLSKSSAPSSIEDLIGLHGNAVEGVASLIQKWDSTPSSLATCLSSALLLKKQLASQGELVELVWTGPVQFAVAARATLTAAREMIAAGTRQITVVGYRVTEGARAIFDSLAERSLHGVRVRIMLDEAPVQAATLHALWPDGYQPPEVYENRTRGLHAKVLVVDSGDALVTSANLTHYGLESNIEFGVRIRGSTARKIDALLDGLVEAGHFHRIDF